MVFFLDWDSLGKNLVLYMASRCFRERSNLNLHVLQIELLPWENFTAIRVLATRPNDAVPSGVKATAIWSACTAGIFWRFLNGTEANFWTLWGLRVFGSRWVVQVPSCRVFLEAQKKWWKILQVTWWPKFKWKKKLESNISWQSQMTLAGTSIHNPWSHDPLHNDQKANMHKLL